MKKIITSIIIVCFLLTASSIVSMANTIDDDSINGGQVLLFINGGVGCHFTVINEGNTTVQAHYSIIGKGLFINRTYYTKGSFTAPPGVWTSAPPVIVPYSFMPITAYLYIENGPKMARSGVSVMGIVLFFL